MRVLKFGGTSVAAAALDVVHARAGGVDRDVGMSARAWLRCNPLPS